MASRAYSAVKNVVKGAVTKAAPVVAAGARMAAPYAGPIGVGASVGTAASLAAKDLATKTDIGKSIGRGIGNLVGANPNPKIGSVSVAAQGAPKVGPSAAAAEKVGISQKMPAMNPKLGPTDGSPTLTKATSGAPTTFQKTPSVGPDATKFASAKPAAPVAAAPAKSSGIGLNAAISDIAKTNKIKDVNKIYTGQKLDLGAGDKYTVQKGDNLTKIAKGFYGAGKSSTPAPKSEPVAPEAPKPSAAPAPAASSPLGSAGALSADIEKKKAEGPAKTPTVRPMQESVQVGDNKYRIV
jgi:LysM repeat protein